MFQDGCCSICLPTLSSSARSSPSEQSVARCDIGRRVSGRQLPHTGLTTSALYSSLVAGASYECIDGLGRLERGWITPGERRFLGQRSASAKAANERRSSASTSGSFRSAATHVPPPSRAYPAGRRRERR